VPAKSQIPGLCGSCHTRVDLMRRMTFPLTARSVLAEPAWQALLKGDQNVATCFDCHDGHKVIKVKDPGALIYPPTSRSCARCHADSALMQAYGIPADQYALYQQSVHGVALLQNQDCARRLAPPATEARRCAARLCTGICRLWSMSLLDRRILLAGAHKQE